jgi:hypothetical protein
MGRESERNGEREGERGREREFRTTGKYAIFTGSLANFTCWEATQFVKARLMVALLYTRTEKWDLGH